MVERVYVIRHGETNDNVVEAARHTRMSYDDFAGFVAGCDDAALTDHGVQQVAQVAEQLRNAGITAIFASPLPRARRTAAILAEALHVERVVEVPELRELRPRGSRRRGVQQRSVGSHLTAAYTRMLLSPRSPDFLPRVVRRVRAAWRRITRDSDARVVAIVSHGWINRFLVGTLRLSSEWRVRSTNFHTCGVSVVERRQS